jgi:hypothetical protein
VKTSSGACKWGAGLPTAFIIFDGHKNLILV